MIRNLKALGLTLVAVFAFSAMAASAASAANFTAAEYPAAVEGEQIVNATFPKGLEYQVNGNVLNCTEAVFDPVGTIAGPGDVTVTPTTNKHCTAHTALGTLPLTYTHNGCNYTLTVGAGSGNTWAGSAHLVCPKGVPGIEIHIYSNHTNHTNKSSLCTYTMHPQTIETGITYHNTHPDVTLTINSTVVTTRVSGSALVCGAATQNAIYQGEITVRAKNGKGEFVTVDVG